MSHFFENGLFTPSFTKSGGQKLSMSFIFSRTVCSVPFWLMNKKALCLLYFQGLSIPVPLLVVILTPVTLSWWMDTLSRNLARKTNGTPMFKEVSTLNLKPSPLFEVCFTFLSALKFCRTNWYKSSRVF